MFVFLLFVYPVSVARGAPACTCLVVQPLPGAAHLLAPASWQLSLAQPHLCLQPAGGTHVPAQPRATPPHRKLLQGHTHIVLHSFKCFWNKREHKIKVCVSINADNKINGFESGRPSLPFWFLKGQNCLLRSFPFHHTWKQICSVLSLNINICSCFVIAY